MASDTQKEDREEKPVAIKVANARLALIFQAFERVGITHRPDFL